MSIIHVISIVVIVKLIQYFYNRTAIQTQETITNCNSFKNKTEAKPAIEKPKELRKNKWLYPDDEFISYKKMKKYKSTNYDIK